MCIRDSLEQVEIEVIVPKMMYGVLKLFANVSKINLNVRHHYDFSSIHLPLSHMLRDPAALHSLSVVTTNSNMTVLLRGLTGLQELSIQLYRNVDGIPTDSLIDCFNESQNLAKLKITGYWYDKHDVEVRKVFHHLPCSLKELTLEGIHLDDDDIKALSERANCLNHLSSLSLSWNNITGVGISLLANTLKLHEALHSLHISGNPVQSDDGIEALAQLTTLEALHVEQCDFTSSGLRMLVNALKLNVNLHTLALTVSDDANIEPLINMTNLKDLFLHDGSYHHEPTSKRTSSDKRSLLKILEHLNQLKKLRFYSNCHGWSNNDKLEIISKAFLQTQVEDIMICEI